MPRLFLGINIPPEAKEKIYQTLNPLEINSKGLEKPHDYHLTLLFIGEASDNEVMLIKERLKKLRFSPFSITTKGFSFFPRRVLYVSFNPSAELLELKSHIKELYPEWNRAPEKPFVPHLTVKRWQRYEYAQLQREIETHPLQPITISVQRVELFKSEKDSFGNKYHII